MDGLLNFSPLVCKTITIVVSMSQVHSVKCKDVTLEANVIAEPPNAL